MSSRSGVLEIHGSAGEAWGGAAVAGEMGGLPLPHPTQFLSSSFSIIPFLPQQPLKCHSKGSRLRPYPSGSDQQAPPVLLPVSKSPALPSQRVCRWPQTVHLFFLPGSRHLTCSSRTLPQPYTYRSGVVPSQEPR